MATSAMFILDLKGKVSFLVFFTSENANFRIFQTIISRNYRGDIDMTAIDKFIHLLMEKEEEGSAAPVLTYQDTNFVFIKHTNIYCGFFV